MLKLKKLTLSAIGRFVDEQTIDFTMLGSLVQVDGQNNNTGGSSGSGKSTIFNALDWLLGLSDISTSVLQSRLTKSHISVSGEFDWDGKTVIITRNRKLSIVVDGAETTGSSKISEETLDGIIGMPRSLFRQLLHKRQGEMGFFLGLTPAKMNEFLVDTLGLSQVRAKIDVIDAKTKDYAQDKAVAQIALQGAQAGLDANKRALDAIGAEPITSVSQDLLEGWATQHAAAKSRADHTQERHKWEKGVLDIKKPKLTSTPFDSSALEALRKEESAVNVKINELLSQEKDRQAAVNKEISKAKLDLSNQVAAIKSRTNTEISILNSRLSDTAMIIKLGAISREEAVKIAAQIKTIRAGTCYTCKQQWISQHEETQLLINLDSHKAKIMAAKDAENAASEFRTAIVHINTSSSKDIEELSQSKLYAISELVELAKCQSPVELPDLNARLRDICTLKLTENSKEARHTGQQNGINNDIMSAFFLEQKSLAAKHQEELQIVNKELQEASNQYERLKADSKSHEINLAQYKKIFESVTVAKKDNELKTDQMGQKLTQIEAKLALAEEAKRCLKSYLSCSFDDALDSISETATRILRSVPTMVTSTVRLEGTKELGNGSVKDQVTACIDSDGELSVPIKSLSGGERSAVDLAIDLAVAELIQEKANKGIDLMILDEPFGGFDSVGIEHALEMLKTLDKRIVLVEHNPIAKEFIDCKVTVIRDGETSYIENKT